MAKKKKAEEAFAEIVTEELVVSETLEPIVLVDESGVSLTEEEAMAEEEKLLSQIDQFFSYQQVKTMTSIPMYVSEQEEEVEDVILQEDEHGNIDAFMVKEATEEKEKEIVPGGGMFEQMLLDRVIRKRLSALSKAYNAIMDMDDHFYTIADGHTILDNLISAYTKERNELGLLLLGKPIRLSALKNERTRIMLEQHLEIYVEKLFSMNELWMEED